MSAQEQKEQATAKGRVPVPTSQSESIEDATSSALGYGVHSSKPVDETEARNTARVPVDAASRGPQNENVDAEQLATFGEGKVANAVERKSGTQQAQGQEVVNEDFAEGLERKKQEQAEAREAIKQQKERGVDVDGSLGGLRVGNEDQRDA